MLGQFFADYIAPILSEDGQPDLTVATGWDDVPWSARQREELRLENVGLVFAVELLPFASLFPVPNNNGLEGKVKDFQSIQWKDFFELAINIYMVLSLSSVKNVQFLSLF